MSKTILAFSFILSGVSSAIGKRLARLAFRCLPVTLQQPLLRQYLVREICAGRRTAEGEMLYLPHVVKSGCVVWDIGANVGEYTFQLSKAVGPIGTVNAFEPMRYNFGTLRATIKRAKLTNVFAHRLALSDHSGVARMRAPSILEHSLGTFSDKGEVVKITSVDELIASGWPAPSFIKCDVEGNAPQVVRGATKLIYDHHPSWLMEVWEHEEITTMELLGYKCYRYPVRGGTLHQVHAREGTTSTYFFISQWSATNLR